LKFLRDYSFGVPWGFLRDSSGLPRGFLRGSLGIPKGFNFPRNSFGITKGFLRDSAGIPWDFLRLVDYILRLSWTKIRERP